MDAHVEIWGCPYNKKDREASSLCSRCVCVCGAPHWGQLQKEELGASPLLHELCWEGTEERSPAVGWLGSTAPAQPLLPNSSCRARLSSSAAYTWGGECSLLRQGDSSAFCAAKSSSFPAEHIKIPNHQNRVFPPNYLPLHFHVTQ